MIVELALLIGGQVIGPYNLVLRWGEGNVTVVRYADQARCELAAAAVKRERDRIMEAAKDGMPPGSVMVKPPVMPYAFCVPA